MARIYAALAALGVALLVIGAAALKLVSTGRKLERAKQTDKVLENVEKAKSARRRVIDNLNHADKLRDKYTRK